MYGNDPRKKIRANINHLRLEMSYLQRRMNSFQKEIERLESIEKGPIADVQAVAEDWNALNWQAFPDI